MPAFCHENVEVLQPRHILELGSGLSTRVLSPAAALSPKCVISSVDHDPQYNYDTGGAPAEPKWRESKIPARPWSSASSAENSWALPHPGEKTRHQTPVDLVVIDGPPVNLGGREGTLYQVMDYAPPRHGRAAG